MKLLKIKIKIRNRDDHIKKEKLWMNMQILNDTQDFGGNKHDKTSK